MTSQPTLVLLTGNDFLIQEGLHTLCTSVFNYHTVRRSAKELFSQVITHRPKLLIHEFDKSDDEIATTLKDIASNTDTEILLIAGSIEKTAMRQLLEVGVKCIVTKQCSQDEITTAIKSALKGERFLCNKVLDAVIDNSYNTPSVSNTLSPREKEVLALITQGNKTAEIAEKLHVSIHTINSHRKNILKKLNLKSPLELIVYAMENGLVET